MPWHEVRGDMRLLATALLALALLSAGCLGVGGDEEPPTPTTATPTPTPEASPTPSATAPVNATPATPTSPTAPTAPAPVAPKVVANQSFDFTTEGDPTGQSPKTKATDAVPAGYGNLTVNVTFTRASTGPTTLPVSGSVNAPRITLLDPDGNEVVSAVEADSPFSQVVPAKPGAWSVRYEGAGTLRASVVVTATA